MPPVPQPGLGRRGFLKALGGSAFGLSLGGALSLKYAREIEPHLLQIVPVDIPLA
jgi:hypothetical protein